MSTGETDVVARLREAHRLDGWKLLGDAAEEIIRARSGTGGADV